MILRRMFLFCVLLASRGVVFDACRNWYVASRTLAATGPASGNRTSQPPTADMLEGLLLQPQIERAARRPAFLQEVFRDLEALFSPGLSICLAAGTLWSPDRAFVPSVPPR